MSFSIKYEFSSLRNYSSNPQFGSKTVPKNFMKLHKQNHLYFRSRRKTKPDNEGKRIRIRPCLGVCQTVEQKCPYMLPADRAPAYPTQYAGEPTFLCLGEY